MQLMSKMVGLLGGSSRKPLTVVSSGTAQSSGTTTVFTPSNTAVGDLLILICGGTDPDVTGGSAEWNSYNQVGGGTNIKTLYKVLAAGDVGASHTISATSNLAPFAWVVYRGPKGLLLRQAVAQASGSTLDFTGFTPRVDSVGAVVIGFSHSGGSASGITFPSSWVTNTSINAFNLKAAISNPNYQGEAISASGISGAVCGTLWELTEGLPTRFYQPTFEVHNPQGAAGATNSSSFNVGVSQAASRCYAPPTDSFVYEIDVTTLGSSSAFIGVCNAAWWNAGATYSSSTVGGGWYYINSSSSFGNHNGATAVFDNTPSFVTNDVLGVAYDASTKRAHFYKNGVRIGVISMASGISGVMYPFVECWAGTTTGSFRATPSSYFSSYIVV